MANLRREPGPFFFFMLVAFTMTLSMSMFFRLFASMTKTIAQALAPSSIILILLVMYTGFVIPIHYMRGYVVSLPQTISLRSKCAALRSQRDTHFDYIQHPLILAGGRAGFVGSILSRTDLRV